MYRFILMMLLVVNAYSWHIKAETTNNIQATQQAQTDPDIIVIQAPDKIIYETDNDGLRCIAENFYCPEIKFKKINQRTNEVLGSWYLNYDTKNITNINYKDGRYSCQYSSNDIIQYTQTFTNKYCQKELLTEKKAIKNGKELFGFDFKKLDSDIDNMKIEEAISSDELAQQLDIITNEADYEKKGFFTLSEMITKILTISDEIKGTDAKMNLTMTDNLNDTDSFTQSYNAYDNSESSTVNLFGRDNDSWINTITNFMGFTDSHDGIDDILDSTTDVKELFNTQAFGYYINWAFMYQDILFTLVWFILIIITVKKAGLKTFDSFKVALQNYQVRGIDKDSSLKFIAVVSINYAFFMMPINERTIYINGIEKKYATTPAQESVEIIASIGTDFADVMTNNGAILITNYLNKISNIYTKDEIKTFTDEIATNLIVAQRERDFFREQCRGAYNIAGDTFMKSQNIFPLRTDYALYNHGVPTLNVCKNTESKIYLNLKSIDENSKLLNYKINNQNSEIVKNMNALNTKLLLTTNDFGWIVSPLLYFSPKLYEDIGTDLEEKQKESISNFSKNFYKDKDIKNINDTMSSKFMGAAQSGVKVISEFSLMHWIPTFTTVQKDIKKKLSFNNEDSISQDKDKDKAKSKIFSFLSKITSKLLWLTGAIVSANSEVLSYILATIIVIANIKALKIAIVIGLMGYKILMYFKDILIYYYFSILIFIRILMNQKNDNIIFLTSKIIYLISYPVFLVFGVTILIFFDKFTQWLLNIILTFQLESMRLTSFVATQNQSGIVDTISTGTSAIMKIGVIEASFQFVILIVTTIVAYFFLVKLPDELYRMIGENISPADNLIEKLENKTDKTTV